MQLGSFAVAFAFSAFIVFLVWLIAFTATVGTPYYVYHIYISLLIYLLCAGGHYLLVYAYKATGGSFLMGYACAVTFYASREIRDRQKLGSWDWMGLWAPIVVITVLFAISEGSRRLVARYAVESSRAQSPKLPDRRRVLMRDGWRPTNRPRLAR